MGELFEEQRLWLDNVFFLTLLHPDWRDEVINVVARILVYYELRDLTP